MKRAVIIHGWGGSPEEGWFPWLKSELEARGFSVDVPAMPQTNKPTIESWVSKLGSLVPNPDEDTVLIGHSIGCQTILRYLSVLPEGQRIGGAVLVAPWVRLLGLDTKESQAVARPWVDSKIDYDTVKKHAAKFTLIFSDDDPVVPVDDRDFLANKLGTKDVIVLAGKGHLGGDSGVTQLPEALQAIGRMTN